MNFYIHHQGFSIEPKESDYIVLYWDNWNDYSYSTLFHVGLIRKNHPTLKLGYIKIACDDDTKNLYIQKNKLQHLIYESSDTEEQYFYAYNALVPSSFIQLPLGFFSIGSTEFYEKLRDLDDISLREGILIALNDIAYDLKLLDKYIDIPKKLAVVDASILRNASIEDIKYQMHRIACGGVTLDEYKIKLPTDNISNTKYISFTVTPYSIPPSNVHAIIGSNGSGKSYLLSHIAEYYIKNRTNSIHSRTNILNLVCISFSPFDRILQEKSIQESNIEYIGLRKNPSATQHVEYKDKSIIDQDFISNTLDCSKSEAKQALWKKITKPLESDYLFKSIHLSLWHENDWYQQCLDSKNPDEVKQKLKNFFHSLGSGHRIILLTLTILVNCLKEKTLVLYDEPETYLHPPLLSALMRSISLLAEERNGIVIVATHSPIVLQEISKNCTWKTHRFGHLTSFSRPNIETFGENSSILNKEVFTLETERAGFIEYIEKIVNDIVKENPDDNLDNAFHKGLTKFDNQLGSEGRIVLLSKLKQKLDKVTSDV